PPTAVLPDLLSVRLSGWMPANPVSDPYTGSVVPGDGAHIFRMDVVFAGLLNPPGPLGEDGSAYEPFLYGPSPVYGFIEIDVDDGRDTGGELSGAATQRYLANVARFGRLVPDDISPRIARSGAGQDYERDFFSDPQFRRSGADFVLS